MYSVTETLRLSPDYLGAYLSSSLCSKLATYRLKNSGKSPSHHLCGLVKSRRGDIGQVLREWAGRRRVPFESVHAVSQSQERRLLRRPRRGSTTGRASKHDVGGHSLAGAGDRRRVAVVSAEKVQVQLAVLVQLEHRRVPTGVLPRRR